MLIPGATGREHLLIYINAPQQIILQIVDLEEGVTTGNRIDPENSWSSHAYDATWSYYLTLCDLMSIVRDSAIWWLPWISRARSLKHLTLVFSDSTVFSGAVSDNKIGLKVAMSHP